MSDRCPNEFPVLDPGELRIAIVGEAPGEDEIHQSRPFTGRSGRLLDDALERVGLVRGRMFVGNVSQHRPKDNSFDHFEWDGAEVQEGIAQLRTDLERFRPNIVLCLGNAALNLFKHGNVAPRKIWRQGRRQFDWPSRVGDWRGSLFASDFLSRPGVSDVQPKATAGPDTCVEGGIDHVSPARCGSTPRLLKCLSAIHPAAVCRDYSLQAYYRVEQGVGDFERLKVEAATPGLELPQREVRIYYLDGVGFPGVIEMLDWLARSPKPVAVDIEGGPGNITSIAFSTRRDVAHVVPLAGIDGRSIWTEEQEVAIWEGAKAVLEDARIPKLVMNASYDFFALPWTYGITPRGELLDIMESFWEWQPELRLGLATQVSLLTREPFYKPDKEEGGALKFASDEEFWRYNGLDAACTVECYEETMRRLDKGQRAHFRFNVELGAGKLYMMLRGVKVEQERVKEEQVKARRATFELQARIDATVVALSDPRDDLNKLQTCVRECVLEFSGLVEKEFASLVLCCLGGKNPAVPTKVVVERWQPMRWSGKKWVRYGKLGSRETLNEQFEPYCAGLIDSTEPPEDRECVWLKPAHKTILRRLPFTPTTLADCEEHVLESKRAEWKRVKAVWKELRHGQANHGTNTRSEEVAGPGHGVAVGSGIVGCLSHLLGELSLLLGLGVNTGSNSEGGDSQWFLYEVCGLPRIYKNERTGKYSRESEKEWKARVAKGASGERKRKGSQTKAAAATPVAQPVAEGAGQRRTVNEHEPGRPGSEAVTVEQDGNIAGRGSGGTGEAGSETGGANSGTGGVDALQVEETPARSSGKRPSTDQQALDLLYAYTRDERCLWVLQQRRLRKVVSDLKGDLVDHDGRARSSVSFVKETGRMAESEAPHGTGLGNRQALNKDLRRLVVAG